jgi:hypothetical protein
MESQSSSSNTTTNKGRQRALVEAADTQQTTSQGFRPTIPSNYISKDLPSTSIQALEYLQYELEEDAKSSGQSPGIREELVAKLREGDKHAFLLMDQLFCKDDDRVFADIPKPLVHWLLLVACTSSSEESMQNMAHGAYLTLLRMMSHGNESCLLFSFKELPLQLQSWFGVGGCGKKIPPDQDPDDGTQQQSIIGGNNKKETVARFLHLWDTAFSQGMVHFDVDISKPATASIVALLLAGLDEMFGSKKT